MVVRDYVPNTGSMGSIANKILDAREVTSLLKKHMSKLVSLRNKDNLLERVRALDNPLQPYRTSKRATDNVIGILPPGERCPDCRKKRQV